MTTGILSELVTYSKYAKYLPTENRRETWDEITDRSRDMHIERYPHLADEIIEAFEFMRRKEVLPSMRSAQFAGKPIELAPNRIYNCAYAQIDHPKVFSELMFLLLGGSGTGYSVQKQHIEHLPPIQAPKTNRTRRFLIGDSIEGWADAVDALMQCYFKGKMRIRFDFSDIRPLGALLKTSGGRAPGPAPLKECLLKLDAILSQKEVGSQLTPLECHDILCHIADAVLAGGIRRAAMICLFDLDDHEMLTCKSGNWFEENPQRGRANNSSVLHRAETTKEDFFNLWDIIQDNNTGDPGVYWTNDFSWGCNPCGEISLQSCQFCNLSELNASTVSTQEELNERARVAAFIGTLQAGYTDFHYLRPKWRETTEKEALIGVSMNGIASGNVMNLDLTEASSIVVEENCRVAKLIGINPAARACCIKPSGNSSAVLETSAGSGAWHNDFYIKRMLVGKDEPLYDYLMNTNPELMEDDLKNPAKKAWIKIPMRAPDNAILRKDEGPIQLLERIKTLFLEWIAPAHTGGMNTNNVSTTVSVQPHQWTSVGEWMWENRECYNGIAVFPYWGGTHKQTPLTDCDKTEYEDLSTKAKKIDLRSLLEYEDNTKQSKTVACAGGACDIVGL